MDKTPTPRGGSRIAPSKHNGRRIALIAGVIVIVALFAFAAWWCGFYQNIYPGTTVNGVDVGGKTVEEATDILAAHFSDQDGSVDLTLDGEVLQTFTTADLHFEDATYSPKREAERAANAAFDAVREKGIGGKLAAIFGRKVDLTHSRGFSTAAITDRIETICKEHQTAAKYPSVSISDDGSELVVTFGADAVGYDNGAVSQRVGELLINGENLPVDLADYRTSVDADLPDVGAAYIDTFIEPRNAQMIKNDEGQIEIIPEVVGRSFDIVAARRLVADRQDFTLPIVYTQPEVTAEVLEANMCRDLLAECFTTVENKMNYDRTNNVRLAAQSIDGTILMPGEEFSYNQALGERTAERGYKKASVYLSNGIEDQLGGGICQTSSTLYMAALRARLEITNRKPHKYSVGYTPLGEDATVYWGSTDFTFRNNRDYPIKIVSWQEGYDITVQIWGTDVDGYKVEISHVTNSYTPFSTIEEENPELEYGKTRQKVQGHSAYSVTTYATVTDADGNQVDYYKVADSRYVLLNRVLEVGTKGRPEPSAPALEPVDTTPPPAETTPTPPPAVTTPEPPAPVETTPAPPVETPSPAPADPAPAPTPAGSSEEETPFIPATGDIPIAPPANDPTNGD